MIRHAFSNQQDANNGGAKGILLTSASSSAVSAIKVTKQNSHPIPQNQSLTNAAKLKYGTQQFPNDEQKSSIENLAATPTLNDNSMEDLEMMLQMQEANQGNDDGSFPVPNEIFQVQPNILPNSYSNSMETSNASKGFKNTGAQMQKTRVVPHSQQKMTKNSSQNLQPAKRDQNLATNQLNVMQMKTLQPKRHSSVHNMKGAQIMKNQTDYTSNPQFYQTIGSQPKIKVNNFIQISNPNLKNDSGTFESANQNIIQQNHQRDHPTGIIESHTMQINSLQDHKNKRVVQAGQNNIVGNNPPGRVESQNQNANTASIVSQIMMNQQIQQNINFQQQNNMKGQMKSKLNIKVLKGGNIESAPKSDANRQPTQAHPLPPSNQSIQSTKVTNPSVLGSDGPVPIQQQHSAQSGGDPNTQKSPTYTQTLSSYNNNSAKPHKTNTKKNIKILSNSASLKKTLQSHASNPSILNSNFLPGSPNELQNMNFKKSQNMAKKNSNQKSETRYQTVLAMDAINQMERNKANQLQGVGGEIDHDNTGRNSDYYRTTQNQKFATQSVNFKAFNSVSPHRNKGNKTSGSVQGKNQQLLSQQKSVANIDNNLGFKNSLKNLHKTNDSKGYNIHLINSASRAARENSKDSIRKKPQAVVNNKGKSMNKFGHGKNSVKPPTKKQMYIGQQAYQKQQQPNVNHGTGSNNGSGNNSPQRMKVSRSSMGVGHPQMQNMQASIMSHSSGSQLSNTSANALQIKDNTMGPQQQSAPRGSSQMNNVYTQLSDRVKRKPIPNPGHYQVQSTSGNSIKPLQRNSSMAQYTKKNQQLHYLPIQAKRGSVAQQVHQTHQENLARSIGGNSSASGSRGGNHQLSNASGRTSDNKFASQERAMKLVEDELNKNEEILAQGQKHLMQKKKASTLQQEEIHAMAAGLNAPIKIQINDKGPHQLIKSGSIIDDRKSPLGYMTQLNQNTMINLNNNNIVTNQTMTPQKGRPRVKKHSDQKNNNSYTKAGAMLMPNHNDKMSFADDIQQFAVLQKINTQSPIDIQSSSNTSKHSNKTFSQSLVSNTNQYAPEVKKIGQQFNEIVKGLQMIEQTKLEQQNEPRQMEENDPPISDVISKLYSVKSSYDQLIKTMSKQITQLQNQIQKPQQYSNVPVMIQPERMTSQRVGATISTSNINGSGSQYNKVSYRKEMTPHGTGIRDPPLSASSQSRTRMDAFVGGTGGSMNKCKYCKGSGMGQAPSSNSASERHTYAVASDRAVHTVENVPMNSIENLSNQNSQNRMISVQRFGNAADHITINLPMPQEQSIESRESQRTKYEEMLEKKFNSEKKGRTQSQSVQASNANEQRNNASNTALLQQIRALKDENKKMDALQEQNKKFIKDLQEKDKQIFKSDRQLAQSQSLVQKKSQELKDTQKKVRELEVTLTQVRKQKQELSLKNQQKMNDRNNSKNKKSQHVQTDVYLENFISEKELDLLVELKNQERKMKKLNKEKTYNANKISKFIYFFFTLQNKGIPVNEIYENDGVKFIQTDRFEEIMGQSNNNNKDDAAGNAVKEGQDKAKAANEDNTDQMSFYSDDSYEYVPFNPDIFERSKFKNINNIQIPSLDFQDLPEYETTDEDEEGDEENSYVEQNNPFEKTENELANQNDIGHENQLMSPAPHDRLNQQMNASTGLKHGQGNQNAIHITDNDLGLDSLKNFNPKGSHPNTSSKKQQQMNKKNYQQSMKYIENFYQQNSSQNVADSESTNQKQKRQNDSGMLFDDAPKSVTEESSMIGDEKNLATGQVNKMQPPGTTSIPNKLFRPEMSQGKRDPTMIQKMNPLMENSIQHNFDQSEKFDESAGQINHDLMGRRLHRIGQGLGGGAGNNAGPQDAMEIMGVTIDSQSFDQSIIDQSMTSELKRKRKARKQKEDLDGSRLFREHGDDDFNEDSMISQGGSKTGQHSQQPQQQISPQKKSILGKYVLQQEENHGKNTNNMRN